MNSSLEQKERNGLLGEQIATLLWPELRLVKNKAVDKMGIDGFMNGESIQIKYDATIAKTGNIYHEIYEKTTDSQQWRVSPHLVQAYIFVTKGKAIKLSIDELAKLERNLPLRRISATSMGFIIPIKATKAKMKNFDYLNL